MERGSRRGGREGGDRGEEGELLLEMESREVAVVLGAVVVGCGGGGGGCDGGEGGVTGLHSIEPPRKWAFGDMLIKMNCIYWSVYIH